MIPLASTRPHLVETTDEVRAFLSWLGNRRPILALDIETTGLSIATDRIRLVQFGDAEEAWAIPYEEWRGLIRHALTVYEGPIVLQNAKFDAGFLQRDGLPFPWAQAHDTKPMLFLTDSLGPQSLKPAAAMHVDPMARAGEAEMKKAMTKNKWTWATIPIDFPPYWGYGCLDTILTARLAEKLWAGVQYARGAYDLEMAVQRVACDMEMRGLRMDVAYVEDTALHLGEWLAASEQSFAFNPNANAQVAQALLDAGVQLTVRTEQGSWSVSEEALKDIDHPAVALLLDYRHKRKMLGTYLEPFLEHQARGRVHPHINTLQAKTGRMSVTNPALQTLPRDPLIRDAILPEEGHKMLLVDYDNEELRVAAHFARDRNMIEALTSGRDLHMETALRVFGPDAGKAERTKAKGGMFSKAYGASSWKIAKTLGITEEQGAALNQALNELYPGLERTLREVTDIVQQRAGTGDQGWVTLPDGRRLSVLKEKGYVGFNALIQGACAVVLKESIVNIDAAGLGHTLRLPIHDELMFSVDEAELDDALPVIRECMERDDFRVPLTVSATTVDRWGDPYRV